MNIFKRVVGIALLMFSFVPIVCPFEHNLDVYICVYKIPRIQNWEAKISDRSGEVTKVRVEGDLILIKPSLYLKIECFWSAFLPVIKVQADSLLAGNQRD
jgi:hypothetical protein